MTAVQVHIYTIHKICADFLCSKVFFNSSHNKCFAQNVHTIFCQMSDVYVFVASGIMSGDCNRVALEVSKSHRHWGFTLSAYQAENYRTLKAFQVKAAVFERNLPQMTSIDCPRELT